MHITYDCYNIIVNLISYIGQVTTTKLIRAVIMCLISSLPCFNAYNLHIFIENVIIF